MEKDKVITIVGLGVVGGSYAIALSKKGYTVYGVNRSSESLELALKSGAIAQGSHTPEKFFEQSDVIIIALYPDQVVDYLKKYGKFIKKGCLISDVAGIKSHFVDEIDATTPDGCEFLFCHPMAGREKRGFKYADDSVLQGANFLIAKTKSNTQAAIDRMSNLVKDIGFGSIRITDVATHDRVIAYTSQLPHAIAVALINSDDENSETSSFIGDSYRDLTRIANINEDLWSELFLGNKDNLISTITSFEEQLSMIKTALKTGDDETLKKLFIKSSQRRVNLEKKKNQ
ncbi:MAG: prephenate dehydrogenase [Clostridia bacterium]|nr:prephenate dehydrogenase [Clostridia bacterium]MDE7328379.1 prephenate dehydrogenase [Clostridia bacterium]